MIRADGRDAGELRPVTIECDVLDAPAGSASIRCGKTWVLCSATVDTHVPRWLDGTGKGWVTAEYAMLPAATASRSEREGWKGRWPKGRTLEIGRLVGRALRGAVNLERLGEHVVTVDCDVLQADGGTRTASVTGGFVALAIALDGLLRAGAVADGVLRDTVCAVSAGVVGGLGVVLDMPYEEDHRAEVDLNVVSTGRGELVEVQCTAEGAPFSSTALGEMVALAVAGNARLTTLQRAALEGRGVDLSRLVAGRAAP
jgi:ribonuclease PH